MGKIKVKLEIAWSSSKGLYVTAGAASWKISRFFKFVVHNPSITFSVIVIFVYVRVLYDLFDFILLKKAMALSFLQFYRNQKYSSQYLHITPVTVWASIPGFYRVTEISPIFQRKEELRE